MTVTLINHPDDLPILSSEPYKHLGVVDRAYLVYEGFKANQYGFEEVYSWYCKGRRRERYRELGPPGDTDFSNAVCQSCGGDTIRLSTMNMVQLTNFLYEYGTEGLCAYCRCELGWGGHVWDSNTNALHFVRSWVLDHIIPKSRRGSDDYWNLIPSCNPCNQKKKNKTPEEFGYVFPRRARFPKRIPRRKK